MNTSPTAFFRNLSLAKKLTFFLVIGTSITVLAYIVIWGIKPEYQPLYSNLNPDDAGVILNKLKEERIPYQVSGAGTILVPTALVFETRMMLASQGLPQGGGAGFEIFDNARFGVTRFEQTVNYQRALQGELSRTINSINEVSASRVHIVMASESVFAEKEKPATASVALKLHPGRRISQDQVNGVIHLVSASVNGLRPENITVVDNEGKLLSGAPGGSALMRSGSDQLDFQHRLEGALQNRVKSMLEEILGRDKTIVRLACDLDFERQERTEELFQPDNKVTRSEQISTTASDGGKADAVGVPGVLSNMTDFAYPNHLAAGKSGFSKRDQTSNYEIGKVTRHIVEPFGKIKRLSVAVIVDGTYRPVEIIDKGNRKVATGELEYLPRTAAELEKITAIVQSAVNFDESRGDKVQVENIRFEKISEPETFSESEWRQSPEIGNAVKYGFILLLLILFYVLLIRPILKWITGMSARDSEILRQLPMTVGEAEREYGGVKSASYLEQARQKIKTEPDSSLRTLREWIKEKP